MSALTVSWQAPDSPGLTAAHYLERAGAEVTIVEGRNRIGGRVHTVRAGFAAGHMEKPAPT